jgi:hypothetical protein
MTEVNKELNDKTYKHVGEVTDQMAEAVQQWRDGLITGYELRHKLMYTFDKFDTKLLAEHHNQEV